MAEKPFTGSGDSKAPAAGEGPGGSPHVGPGDPAGGRGAVREAVGIFHDRDGFQAAVDDLAMAGFAPHEMSLMAGDEAVRAKFGQVPTDIRQAKDDPDMPRQGLVSPEEVGDAQGMAIGVPAYIGAILGTGVVIASGGTALAAVAAAALAGGAGGGVGALLANWIGGQRENLLQQQLDKGGLLLWVNLRDAERERLAREIIARHTEEPVEVHAIPQAGSQA